MSGRQHHRVLLRVRTQRGVQTFWLVAADGVPVLVWTQARSSGDGLLLAPFGGASR